MKYYILYADVSIEGYAIPGPDIKRLLRSCEFSEFQFLTHDPMDVALSNNGGLDFPDLMICEGCIPLISQRLRESLLYLSLDNIFYKPINLVYDEIGIKEPRWLALPSRIDCLDWEKCKIEEEYNSTFPFWSRLYQIKKIVIDQQKIGYYKIFKLPPCTLNQQIIIDEELKLYLEQKHFENLFFFPLD